MVLIIRSDWISRVPPYFSYTFFNLYFDYRGLTFFARLSQNVRLYKSTESISGSSNFARHYFRNRCYFLFLTLLRYFNSGGLACFRIVCLLHTGFAHSDSPGSLLTYSSPKRFAVRRVLLRLLVPRHPLCALFSLTFLF